MVLMQALNSGTPSLCKMCNAGLQAETYSACCFTHACIQAYEYLCLSIFVRGGRAAPTYKHTSTSIHACEYESVQEYQMMQHCEKCQHGVLASAISQNIPRIRKEPKLAHYGWWVISGAVLDYMRGAEQCLT